MTAHEKLTTNRLTAAARLAAKAAAHAQTRLLVAQRRRDELAHEAALADKAHATALSAAEAELSSLRKLCELAGINTVDRSVPYVRDQLAIHDIGGRWSDLDNDERDQNAGRRLVVTALTNRPQPDEPSAVAP